MEIAGRAFVAVLAGLAKGRKGAQGGATSREHTSVSERNEEIGT